MPPAKKHWPKIDWDDAAQALPSKSNPAPRDGQLGYLHPASGGLRLRAAVYAPTPNASARTPYPGTIIIMTGYGEFLEKYFETIRDVQAAGLGVALMEWRGHGLSTRALPKHPLRLHLENFDTNLADLEYFWSRVVVALPRPHFGLAHSMGGQIALRAVQRHPDWMSALTLSAPLLGLPTPSWLRPLMRMLVAGACVVGLGTRSLPVKPTRAPGCPADNNVTSDTARFERNEALAQRYPQLLVGATSLSWIRAVMRAMTQSRQRVFLRSITTPIFMGMAMDDKIVSLAAQTHAVAHLPQVEAEEFSKAGHELLQERTEIRRKFLQSMLAHCHRHAG